MASRTAEKYGKTISLKGELKFVRLGSMKVSALAQRELREHRVDYLLSVFDPDKMGVPRVSHRDGHYFVVDGQHRVEACKKWLGKGWEDVSIECWVIEGLTEEQEAEYFLSLNDVLSVNIFQKFKVALKAGRQAEVDIATLLDGLNLKISQQDLPGTVSAVGSLIKSFNRDGSDALRKALCIAKNAYGDSALKGSIIDGLSLMCGRYNGSLNEKVAIDLLAKVNGGINGLLNMGRGIREKTGRGLNHCVASAAVTIINRGLTAKNKLPGWFKEEKS